MAGVAEVLSADRGKDGLDIKADPGGEDALVMEHFADAGDDSVPLPGDMVASSDGTDSGAEQVTGYHDVSEKKAAGGEKRIYSRNAPAVCVAEIWLKKDGTIIIKNRLATAGGSVEVGADGTVTINGVTISPQGAITAPGEVTAMAATPATAVKVSTHLHPTALGPSGPPTPGT